VLERQFLHEVIVHHCIGELRPPVNEVPPQHPCAVPLAHAEELDEELERLSLHVLAQAGEVFQVVRDGAEHRRDLVAPR